jgi:chromate transporter
VNPLSLFLIFLKLGLTSFGGPVAHIGYFRNEFVSRRRWLGEEAFADIVSLCQFLPGPASSQVGIAIGLIRGGARGAVAAWLGFTLPSALLMIGFAYAERSLAPASAVLWFHGLLIVAVAVVAQAVWGMAQSLAPDRERASLAVLAAVAMLAIPAGWTPLAILAVAAIVGRWLLPARTRDAPPIVRSSFWPRGVAQGAAAAFALLLFLLPPAARLSGLYPVELVDAFYRVGALVFGGGHVVLPMLQAEVVPRGWVLPEDFLAGYGAAQAVPGPLFSFAAYLGAVSRMLPNGWTGGVIALVAIYLPSFLMVAAALPYWTELRRDAKASAALSGVNAAVVGILLAALYTPVWTSAIQAPKDFLVALLAFGALQFWRAPAWSVVLATTLLARVIA